MKASDYIIFGVLIALCLAVGIIWLVTKGRFVNTDRQYSEAEEKALSKRSKIAGIFYISISVIIALTMVAMNYQIKWLMVTCFVLVIVCCIAFMIVSRLIYRRHK